MNFGGRDLYLFETRVQIPPAAWATPPSACASSETYLGVSPVRASPQPSLISLETESLSGINPFACLDDNDYDASKCASRRSPLSRLLFNSQISRHEGDVVIRNLTDHTRHRCYDTIVGDLRVENTVGEIDMPELRDVTGDVILEYPVDSPVAAPHRGSAVPRYFPQLARVEGSLRANARAPSGIYTQRHLQMEMPLLERVGGDVDLLNVGPSGEQVAENGYFRGLESLGYIGGDVRFSNHSDRYFDLMNSLRRVDGSVYLGSGKVNGQVFEILETIGGDLEIPRTRVKTEILANLATVEGDARLSFHWAPSIATSERNLESLERIGGSLELTNSVREDFALGAFPVSVGALVVEDNDRLVNIQLGEVSIRDSGEARFVNNSQLCRSGILALLSAQAGWTGVSSIIGNDNSC